MEEPAGTPKPWGTITGLPKPSEVAAPPPHDVLKAAFGLLSRLSCRPCIHTQVAASEGVLASPSASEVLCMQDQAELMCR